MMIKEKINLKTLWVFGLVWAVLVLSGVATAKEVAVIKVQYRRAAELVPVVQSLLSEQGTVTASERVNSLVVVDTVEAIQRVYAYIEQFDTPVEQVRIHVRFHTENRGRQYAHDAGGRYSDDDLRVSAGSRKKDRTTTMSKSRIHQRSSHTEAFVIAMSGSPAFIRTGKEIPYQSSSPFFRRHAPGDETIAWQTVESGFEVTPTIAGDNVILKIVPRIAYDFRQDAVIRFFGAQTELTAPFGQWVEIAGTSDQQNQIFQEILSQRERDGRATTSMSVMVQPY